ncbi:hypothetical protein CVD28_03110 [Bacillus sp. M6-12]|uniref:hypothetical protein n=1 Tax=Bacillus sp. M6-12 TaxID=2054166 RepID=UPI000C785557|nr:hypothetical protein [Bacillus sp. M6-12]PLS19419.1 hypothetical protein CVD28_03110 [Bacillus sp. M6-12]
MEKSKHGVHAHHCCIIHGCKYGNDDCPVTNKEVQQVYTCEYCSEEGFKTVQEIKEYILLKEDVKDAKECGCKNISVSVELLDKILNKQSYM